jgi:hypothetical protein
MLFGLYSGHVTAGVLRGQKSRFQLFGDTVNTAARMESTGVRNRIHLSETTSALLIKAGKENWVALREDAVNANKGKGTLKTDWLAKSKTNLNYAHTMSSNPLSSGSSASSNGNYRVDLVDGGFDQEHELWGGDKGALALPPNSRNAKNTRLVDWLVDVISIGGGLRRGGGAASGTTNRVPFNVEYRQVFRSVAHHLLPVAHHLLPLRPTPSQKMTRNTRRPDKISSKHRLEMHRVSISISQKLIHQGPKLLEIHRLSSHLSFRRWTLIMMPSSQSSLCVIHLC